MSKEFEYIVGVTLPMTVYITSDRPPTREVVLEHVRDWLSRWSEEIVEHSLDWVIDEIHDDDGNIIWWGGCESAE